MKVAVVFVAVLAVLVVCVPAQQAKDAKKYLREKYNSLRHMIVSAAEQNKLPVPKTLTWKNRDSCDKDEYMMVPQRLMDWFHVLKAIHLKNSKQSYYGKDFDEQIDKHQGCSPVFKWFFKEYDVNNDMVLNIENELQDIVSIPTEHCLKPFFQHCDKNKDHKLSLDETCNCFNTVEPPCFEEMKDYKETPMMLGQMRPECDEDGFYKSRQCHENFCWCVDRFNQKVEGTEARGLVDCPDNTDPNEIVFTGGEEDEDL